MTDAERNEHFAKELEWVASRLRAGRAGEQEIEALVNTICTIRQATPATSTEAEINREYIAAKQAESIAAEKIGVHYWPLVKACATEQEARDLLNRVPSCVEKAFFIDYFHNVSKVIPRKTA